MVVHCYKVLVYKVRTGNLGLSYWTINKIDIAMALKKTYELWVSVVWVNKNNKKEEFCLSFLTFYFKPFYLHLLNRWKFDQSINFFYGKLGKFKYIIFLTDSSSSNGIKVFSNWSPSIHFLKVKLNWSFA